MTWWRRQLTPQRQPHCNIYTYQIHVSLDTLNIYTVICQLHLNTAGKKDNLCLWEVGLFFFRVSSRFASLLPEMSLCWYIQIYPTVGHKSQQTGASASLLWPRSGGNKVTDLLEEHTLWPGRLRFVLLMPPEQHQVQTAVTKPLLPSPVTLLVGTKLNFSSCLQPCCVKQ